MSARWPLTLALASLEDEIWSTTPFAAVGLMVPAEHDVVSFEFHTPVVMEYHWPGNVRELRNILELAAILCDGGLITAEHLALNGAPPRTVEREAVMERAALAEPAGDLSSMERDDRAGAGDGAVQQVEGRRRARPHARAALCADAPVRLGVTR